MMPAFLSPPPLLSRPHRSLTRPPPAAPAPRRPHLPPTATHPDVAIIGAGLAGLSTAHELAQRGASVTVLTSPTLAPAALAAAGMLAPHAEPLPPPLRALCLHSRLLYPSFVHRLSTLSGLDLRYVSRSDFLAPLLPPHPPDPAHVWLPPARVRLLEPALTPALVAARRLPADAHVDNRALHAALRAACLALGVTVRDDAPVHRLVVAPHARALDAVQTVHGEHVRAAHYVLAAGAWSARLLPSLPVRPVKGQMLALRAPPGDEATRLKHVLYTHDIYIVPKEDGSLFFVGATVEEGTFSVHNTPAGVAKLLNAAIELVPAFANYELVETWSGLRPATPDLQPVLGMSEYQNMSIATGYYRNGILLAPATAKIAAATALNEISDLPKELRDLIPQFSIARFLGQDSFPSEQGPVSTPASNAIKRDMVEAAIQPPQPPQPASPIAGGSLPTDNSAVKVWRILPDGTQEPVLPANISSPAREDRQTETVQSEAPTTVATPSAQEQHESNNRQTKKPSIPAPETASGSKDAYEDIMQYRGDAERVMNEALAANRAFGRTKSSLEVDGGPVLSLSEEDVIAFDAALEKGLEDMREAEKSYDENHPSVIATTAEKARVAKKQNNDTHGLNGSSIQVSGIDQSPQDTTMPSEGYF